MCIDRLGKQTEYLFKKSCTNLLAVQAFFVIFASFAITGCHHGTGQHAWDIQPPEELPVAIKVWDTLS